MELWDLVESRVETPLIYVYIFGRVDNQRNPSKHRPCDVLGSWALSQVKGLLLLSCRHQVLPLALQNLVCVFMIPPEVVSQAACIWGGAR